MWNSQQQQEGAQIPSWAIEKSTSQMSTKSNDPSVSGNQDYYLDQDLGGGYEERFQYLDEQPPSNNIENQYVYENPFYSQRSNGSSDFLPQHNRQFRSIMNDMSPNSIMQSPATGDNSRTQSPLTTSMQSNAPCRQLPCRTFISTGSCPYRYNIFSIRLVLLFYIY